MDSAGESLRLEQIETESAEQLSVSFDVLEVLRSSLLDLANKASIQKLDAIELFVFLSDNFGDAEGVVERDEEEDFTRISVANFGPEFLIDLTIFFSNLNGENKIKNY
ncbi:hypothetical protein QR98_0055950 [Sarcoptes scabiei]|uniref:Uncharacterized protein n=1 Tax=Sarcoptes scabiei TaxID=52283 RepID=A0A132A816_SARSC|nr:hypothetical protein QR98_0055950 [Sarcoptes scabiei]